MTTYICNTCGKDYSNSVKTFGADHERFENDNCGTCNFWWEKVEWLKGHDADRSVIVDGKHYRIGSYCPEVGMGFGGSFWAIEFDNGIITATRNLWHQGTIDEPFGEHLPNNARFLTKLGKTSRRMLENGWTLKRVGADEFLCYKPGNTKPAKHWKDGAWL